MAMAKRAKDINSCMTTLKRMSDGQASVSYVDDNTYYILLQIIPNDGVYNGAEFHFRINLDDQYPLSRPTVDCLTPIFHPNIDTFLNGFEDNVCMTILEEWSPNYTIEDCLQGLLYILHNPNLTDVLNPLCGSTITPDEFRRQVANSLEGKIVEGIQFPVNCKRMSSKNGIYAQQPQQR